MGDRAQAEVLASHDRLLLCLDDEGRRFVGFALLISGGLPLPDGSPRLTRLLLSVVIVFKSLRIRHLVPLLHNCLQLGRLLGNLTVGEYFEGTFWGVKLPVFRGQVRQSLLRDAIDTVSVRV